MTDAAAIERRRRKAREAVARHKRTPRGMRSAAAARKKETEALRALVIKFKSVPCDDCGGTFDPVCMDFDHRPGEVKLFSVAKRKSGIKKVMEEIAKCDVVCANCHRLRTFKQRDHAIASQSPRPERARDRQLILDGIGKT